MTKRDDGGPAFPTKEPINYDDRQGMTLRDWFAGQALPAIIAYAFSRPNKFEADESGNVGPAVCKAAYLAADAMLEERNK